MAMLQDKHTDMMAAFEVALSAQSSKYTTVSQQLRLELKEALVKANQVCSGAWKHPHSCHTRHHTLLSALVGRDGMRIWVAA